MSERKPFNIEVGKRQLSLTLGTLAVCLFRRQQEVDYFCVDLDQFTDLGEEGTLRVFCNEDLCRYMAGFSIKEYMNGRFQYVQEEWNGSTFAEEYGWNPPVIIKEEPSEKEKEWYADIVGNTLEDEWEHWGDDGDS